MGIGASAIELEPGGGRSGVAPRLNTDDEFRVVESLAMVVEQQ